jgi:hypothetical protein
LSSIINPSGWMDGWMVGGYEQENTFSLGPVQLLTTVGLAKFKCLTTYLQVRSYKPTTKPYLCSD